MGVEYISAHLYFRNILYLAPLVVFASLVVGCLFFWLNNGWDFPTVLFYSTQTLFGCIYDVPLEVNFWGKWFSLAFFIWGVFLVAGAIGAFAITIVEKAAKEEKNRKIYAQMDLDGDGEVGWKDWITYHIVNFAIWAGWYHSNRNYIIFIAVFVWILVGMVYAYLYEEYNLVDSLYFSIGTMATSGLPTPRCSGGDGVTTCEIEPFRAYFYTMYIMVGVPLFTMTLGQFTLSVVQRAIHFREMESLRRPLDEEDYRYACSLRAESTGEGNIDFAEFIVMELLRLKKVDIEDITFIKELFDEIDYDHTGIIDRKKLIRQSLIIAEEINEAVEPQIRDLIPDLEEFIPACSDILAVTDEMNDEAEESEQRDAFTPMQSGKYGSLSTRDLDVSGHHLGSTKSFRIPMEISDPTETETIHVRQGLWAKSPSISPIQTPPDSPHTERDKEYPMTPRDLDLTDAIHAVMLTAHTRMMGARAVTIGLDRDPGAATGDATDRSRSSTVCSPSENISHRLSRSATQPDNHADTTSHRLSRSVTQPEHFAHLSHHGYLSRSSSTQDVRQGV